MASFGAIQAGCGPRAGEDVISDLAGEETAGLSALTMLGVFFLKPQVLESGDAVKHLSFQLKLLSLPPARLKTGRGKGPFTFYIFHLLIFKPVGRGLD